LKPIKLILTAFGPYKQKQEINFQELQGHQLFLVSGKTGAGKTTIFDALCFALYGSASGEDRDDVKLLRSDFSEDDVHTAVELYFELKGRFFRILRQLPHVKKGNKSATGERYEFYESVKGKEIPAVDRQMVTEINKRIEQLVGLTQGQFKQIVMLPQGEFRKLLTSQTEEKEDILRRIFNTQTYQLIGERLRERRKEQETLYNRERESLNYHLQSLQASLPQREEAQLWQVLAQTHYYTPQVVEELKAEISFYEREGVRHNQHHIDTYKRYHQELDYFHQAKGINDRFAALKDKEQKQLKKQTQLPLIREKEERLEAAYKASQLEPYEAQVNEWRQEENKVKQVLKEEEVRRVEAEQRLAQSKYAYQQEEARKSERESLQREVGRLEDLMPAIKELEEKKKELSRVEVTLNKITAERNSMDSKVTDAKQKHQMNRQRVKELEQEVSGLTEKHERLATLRIHFQIISDYLKLEKECKEKALSLEQKKQSYEQVKQQYSKLEEEWLGGQASLLAAHLHDGAPCPVCGSKEHPAKAELQQEIKEKEILEALKKELSGKEDAFRLLSAAYHSNQELRAEKAMMLEEIGIEEDQVHIHYERMLEDGKVLRTEVEKQNELNRLLTALKKEADKLEQEVTQQEADKAALEHTWLNQKSAYDGIKAVLQVHMNQIPEALRSLDEAEQQLQEEKSRLKQMVQLWEVAQKNLQEASDRWTQLQAEVLQLGKQTEETKQRRQRAEDQFTKHLTLADFKYESDYKQAKLSPENRELLKREITDYHQAVATLSDQIEDLKQELKEKQKVDLVSKEAQLIKLKEASEVAQQQWQQTKEYEQHANKHLKLIEETYQRIERMEHHLNQVTDLYDVVRGQNQLKLSFERYLQIEFLEQIILVANDRLKRLSHGQYYLVRSERQESRGKQSGLGLDVYDAYTGQKRDVKSLSGGEKFNASLCLALGMADVIQSYQGGISIDTLFIDEGFGTLDEESLNQAIDTLIDLQQTGRLIGVISHVQELKMAIPAILEVSKTREGYSQARFVIQ
jgi:exonuclease SbcC